MRVLFTLLFTAAVATAAPPQAPQLPQAPKQTICDCADTLKCTCWESQCACVRCGGAAKVPKALSSTTAIMPGITARNVTTKEAKLAKSVDTGAEGTTNIPVLIARSMVYSLGGTTSNCPNGNCPTSATGRRRR